MAPPLLFGNRGIEGDARMLNRIIYAVDQLSKSVGHAFAWCIVTLTLGTCYEVFVRYLMNNPTSWAFDMSYLMYGAVFYMAGAYTLSRGGHVRADMYYRKWQPRTQARVELLLLIIFFFPGVLALIYSGWGYGYQSMRILEVSVNSPAGVPIWPMKMMIPIGAALLALQGVAEVLRCVLCLKQGHWEPRLHDVQEMADQILEDHAKTAQT